MNRWLLLLIPVGLVALFLLTRKREPVTAVPVSVEPLMGWGGPVGGGGGSEPRPAPPEPGEETPGPKPRFLWFPVRVSPPGGDYRYWIEPWWIPRLRAPSMPEVIKTPYGVPRAYPDEAPAPQPIPEEILSRIQDLARTRTEYFTLNPFLWKLQSGVGG
jgi:hypothetical protein